MYVNKIDNIIDQILDNMYLEGLAKDETFKSIVEGNKINYVEERDKINDFIKNYMTTINVALIQTLINNKENLIKILDIIKRYVAYYYFLTIAYYYTGTLREFGNNLVQYTKLQENSPFVIKNFFDAENNHQIIKFFKIIKDTSKILLMTELQKKTLNISEVKESVDFLNRLGVQYINNYILTIITLENGEERVEINVHNLIKTIVFGEIYRNQEQGMVFEILNDIEEDKHEYTFIDIVVSSEEIIDFESFKEFFLGEKNVDVMARDFYELQNEMTKIQPVMTAEIKNNKLLKFRMITPIVDNFLRYHRDSERLETETDKLINLPLVSTNNAKNIQMALLYQQRKKKENTRAQLIVSKIDAISDYYSENVQNNPEILKDIKKYFQGPLAYRKAVLHNYLDEVKVVNKIKLQGRAAESNEYYLELMYIISNAYFNFKDFMSYGTSITLGLDFPINMLRYSNIEFQQQHSHLEVDMHTGVNDSIINVVGMALGPFEDGPIQCIKKENMVDIRSIQINYLKNGILTTKESDNGYKTFLRIIKYFYINTISINTELGIVFYHNFDELRKINSTIFDKIIYWVYDVTKDEYKMETYENVKLHNFQETIRLMNSVIYDKIVQYLHNKLVQLILHHRDLSLFQITILVELYTTIFNLSLKDREKTELIIKTYLKTKPALISKLVKISEKDRITMPEYIAGPGPAIFRIKIDMINPLNLQEYIRLDVYRKEEISMFRIVDSKCQHEMDWEELSKYKSQDLNKYNAEITQFIEKYAIETTQHEIVCKVCGRVLPLKIYVQDGRFNNITQVYVSSYVPLDIPLEEIKEYAKYKVIIRYLDILINRLSLVTGTNMLVGQQPKEKRKNLVKNIIDIVIKHNSVNLAKRQRDEDRLDFFARKFNIDKELDCIHFFELDDTIIPTNRLEVSFSDISKLKYNNLILYVILLFMTELNGAQITMMAFDKIANIHTYLKFGPKQFGNLLIKKNINDMETVPIIRFPIFCYLIFLISYFLITYKMWHKSTSDTKPFNPLYQKIIINSIVDLFNSISMDAGKMPDDYIYKLTTTRLYSQLNTVFSDKDIINILKRNHARYSLVPEERKIKTEAGLIKTYSIQNPIQIVMKTRKIPSFRISNGLEYDRRHELLYHRTYTETDISNCPIGSSHHWSFKAKGITCTICNEKGEDVHGEIDRSKEAYYYVLNVIASTRRCLDGTIHDFKNGITCSKCNRKLGDKYTEAELDKLASNLSKIENDNIQKMLKSLAERQKEIDNINTFHKKIIKDLRNNYQKETGDKIYGQMPYFVDKLIKILESLIGADTNLEINKYMVYLNDNVYIIDHQYNGTLLKEPIMITQKENRVHFRENHSFFKTDVYYYTDNRTQIDVFYHAVTLKLMGYKEKHRDYVKIGKINVYLKISPSIKNRMLTIGYETKYIDIHDVFVQGSKLVKDANENYYIILDNLIREHIYKIKSVIDKISSLIYKIKYYQPAQETDTAIMFIQSNQDIDKLSVKYSKILKEISLGVNDMAFEDWNEIRDLFFYEQINWPETNVKATDIKYINSDLINYYDISSNIMIYYLVEELISILNSNADRNAKVNIAQMYVELLSYVYNIYNIDYYKNSLELKRFEYILNGSDLMVDILRKGQGLQISKELEEEISEIQDIANLSEITDVSALTEEQKDELEDLREEADAIDVESDYYKEEDEDYAEVEEYES